MRTIIINCDRCGKLVENSHKEVKIEIIFGIKSEYQICHECGEKLDKFFKTDWKRQKTINKQINDIEDR